MDILHDYRMLKKHTVLKTYSDWREKKLDTNDVKKTTEILTPLITSIIKEDLLTDNKKEIIKEVASRQEEIYTAHLGELEN